MTNSYSNNNNNNNNSNKGFQEWFRESLRMSQSQLTPAFYKRFFRDSFRLANLNKINFSDDQSNSKKTIDKEISERGQWGSQLEFFLSCVGYSVGLGNVWRFPYLAYSNGGGAFLIPYAISVILAGLPFYFLELSLGQFSRLGPTNVFGNMCPIFQGLGWAMVVVSLLVALYYNMVVAWVLYYFGASFSWKLPWSDCSNEWNTENCSSDIEDSMCQTKLNDSRAMFYKKTCLTSSQVVFYNINVESNVLASVSPADEYFNHHVLMVSNSMEEMGYVSWKLALCLFFAWLLVFLCLAKGVQSSGKVVYFTATFPYVVLLILLIRGVTLDGATDGLYFYFVPNVTKLKEAKVWKDAAEQVFYSLGPAFGGLITMASYNKFSNNCKRDAILVCIIDSCTSAFAGCAIFSITGYMAKILKRPVSQITKSGMGLAFIAYPEAIVRLPASQLWSVLFFFMLITLGMDSEFAMLETVTTALLDTFPYLRTYKTYIIGATCISCFLLGLPMCTQGGVYIFTLLNEYSSGYCLIVLGFLECAVVSYGYGIIKFSDDIEMMLGVPPNLYFKLTWMFVTPAFMIFILVSNFVNYVPSRYGSYIFTKQAEDIGWLVSSLPLSCLPIFAIYRIVKNRINKKVALITSTVDWARSFVRKKIKKQTKLH